MNWSTGTGSARARSSRPQNGLRDDGVMMSKSDLLRTIPIFNSLTEKDRRKIAGEMVETRYGKGEYIFREGDPADGFHILKEGSVK
ncbi:MAG: cyclic nucleotide-binding domain-containing protein, partial [Nitrospira sp.]|nr:cyclic nucleotide-binding domain-containing protein [Nitrospira sp.]